MERLHDLYDRVDSYMQSKRAGRGVCLSYLGRLDWEQSYSDFRLNSIRDISAMLEPTPANLVTVYSFAGQFHFMLASDESSLPYEKALQIQEQLLTTLLASVSDSVASVAMPVGSSYSVHSEAL
jgi:hypothetical protein